MAGWGRLSCLLLDHLEAVGEAEPRPSPAQTGQGHGFEASPGVQGPLPMPQHPEVACPNDATGPALCLAGGVDGKGELRGKGSLTGHPPRPCVPRDPVPCLGLSGGPLGHGGYRGPWCERQDGGRGRRGVDRARLGLSEGPLSSRLVFTPGYSQAGWGPGEGLSSLTPPTHHTSRVVAGAPCPRAGSQVPRIALCLSPV